MELSSRKSISVSERFLNRVMKKEKIERWRSVVGGLVGSVTVGVVLLGLVVAGAVVTAKKRRRRAKREEKVRKTYEEEALRVVTMVGHSTVFVASPTRTLPGFVEHECVPN
ncbi:BnaA03g54720D [Brassica napus]|uniref:BnaA03g54720D protein n=1 Tax=Brassica napus TaxID=3708 RepID=A0A078H0I1_BRANA|nr:BnaA03g54720D [Brassica napus]